MTDSKAQTQRAPAAGWHLAQVNVARMRAPLEDPIMSGFVEQLEFINALADRSPGFVWRLQTEAGNNTDVRVFEDPLILFNMSVWESIEALRNYVYRSAHREPLRDRKQWFVPMDTPHMVLWWVPADYRPSVPEAVERLEHLRSHGPTPHAFSFAKGFDPPAQREEA